MSGRARLPGLLVVRVFTEPEVVQWTILRHALPNQILAFLHCRTAVAFNAHSADCFKRLYLLW